MSSRDWCRISTLFTVKRRGGRVNLPPSCVYFPVSCYRKFSFYFPFLRGKCLASQMEMSRLARDGKHSLSADYFTEYSKTQGLENWQFTLCEQRIISYVFTGRAPEFQMEVLELAFIRARWFDGRGRARSTVYPLCVIFSFANVSFHFYSTGEKWLNN